MTVDGVDIQRFPVEHIYDNYYVGDFLSLEFPHKYDKIVENPPYYAVTDIIYKAMDILPNGGYLSFMLKLAFLVGQERMSGLFKKYPLKEVMVSASRIPFRTEAMIQAGKKSSNTFEYAQFIWQKGHNLDNPIISWFNYKDVS